MCAHIRVQHLVNAGDGQAKQKVQRLDGQVEHFRERRHRHERGIFGHLLAVGRHLLYASRAPAGNRQPAIVEWVHATPVSHIDGHHRVPLLERLRSSDGIQSISLQNHRSQFH